MPSKSSDPQRWLNDIRHNIHLARRFTEASLTMPFATTICDSMQ